MKDFLNRIVKSIVKEYFQNTIDGFETRIRELENEVMLLKKCNTDNEDSIREINKDIKQINQVTYKTEGIIRAVLHLNKGKVSQLDDGNNE